MVLLIVAIFAAIVLVTYRKLQSNDDHSKLVKCYHALCPGRHLEALAGQRDTGTADYFLESFSRTVCKNTIWNKLLIGPPSIDTNDV